MIPPWERRGRGGFRQHESVYFCLIGCTAGHYMVLGTKCPTPSTLSTIHNASWPAEESDTFAHTGLTVKAMCSAAGFCSPFKCQPFLLSPSPSAYMLTAGFAEPKATTDTRGSPRIYRSEGNSDFRSWMNRRVEVRI
jgi:hypothetical protein